MEEQAQERCALGCGKAYFSSTPLVWERGGISWWEARREEPRGDGNSEV